MKKPVAFLTSFIALVIALSLVQVVVASRLTTTGVDLAQVQTKLDSLEKENAVLSEKLLVLSSYNQIASKAGELGFVTKHDEYFLSPQVPVARKQ